jgi:hypothetical protein
VDEAIDRRLGAQRIEPEVVENKQIDGEELA